MILVVCAVRAELKHFAARPDVEIAACGVGPVEAAVVTARLLERSRYAAVVNAGIAGAFRGIAAVGDAVLVASEFLSGLGLEGGAPLALPGGTQLVERAEADAELLSRCSGIGLHAVRGLTVSTITTTDETANGLRARYDAGVESMEGFSILRAGAIAKVPALEVRGISNYVGDRARSAWDFEAGARATAAALDAVLDHICR